MYFTSHRVNGKLKSRPFSDDSFCDFYNEALRLHALGISTIPIGSDKRPVVRWKQYQREKADEQTLWFWFFGRDDLNLGFVLGSASMNVCGRDFDTARAFYMWIDQHRKLAKELPIALSRRGGHVYFRNPNSQTMPLDDGEIRGNGSFLICPPSLHESGYRYEWLNPFRNIPRWIDPIEEGLIPKTVPRRRPIEWGESCEYVRDRTVESAITHAIKQTLPTHYGQRNDLIFEFARRLKGIPELRNRTARQVLIHAEQWFRAALPTISTKPWPVTREAFLSAWTRITHPWTDGTLSVCLADVDASPPSPVALHYVRDPVAMRLVRLCESLQAKAGAAPFFLSTAACVLFHLPHKTQLHRRIKLLIRDGVLQKVSVGNSYQRKANEYRFLPAFERTANR